MPVSPRWGATGAAQAQSNANSAQAATTCATPGRAVWPDIPPNIAPVVIVIGGGWQAGKPGADVRTPRHRRGTFWIFAHTKSWLSVGLVMVQRLRRCTITDPTLNLYQLSCVSCRLCCVLRRSGNNQIARVHSNSLLKTIPHIVLLGSRI